MTVRPVKEEAVTMPFQDIYYDPLDCYSSLTRDPRAPSYFESFLQLFPEIVKIFGRASFQGRLPLQASPLASQEPNLRASFDLTGENPTAPCSRLWGKSTELAG